MTKEREERRERENERGENEKGLIKELREK